ncbi:MAG: M14 metallopeptidase family protein [Edaphobacter sp.]
MKLRTLSLSLCLLTALPLASQTVESSRKITPPKQAFGFNIGDDYHLANYVQLTAYWQTLAKESDRMKLVDIGPTAEGRRQYMAVISSPENIARLDHYREISEKLARAENLTDAEAHALAEEGKAVIWIDGGLHASETVGAQQLIETVYQLNALTDPETLRLLHDDIVLCVLDNPDGLDLVADWYNREPVPEKRFTDGPAGGTPRLWQKYIGHDDNRDFYMNNMPETTNISRVLFREWYPQIMYNHHQTGPLGTVIFMPPFRDPFNYHYDPLIPLKIEAVGTAMHERLVEENKPGSGMRSTANYSTWYNGGLRTVTYFHNMVGILTEIIGSPTPMQLPLVPARQLPSNDLPFPVAPQTWHYSQSIAYEQTNNRAILDYASREREHLLYDTYRMAKNSIDRGSEDSWTVTPKRIAALEAEAAAEAAKTKPSAHPEAPAFENAQTAPADLYKKVLHDPTQRDPRGYILSADQPDFPTTTKFINALMKSGVEIEQATADFTVAGKHYPRNSYIVLCAQAYRPQILDMFEPQDHPNDFAYPGGPPNRPYDATGWTLAFQMGVQFDRELEPFTGPFAKINTDLAVPLPGAITGPAKPAGYLVSHDYNDAFTLTNRLLKAQQPVYWLTAKTTVGDKELAPGTLWLPYSTATQKILEASTKQLGINAYAVAKKPTGDARQLHAERIALYDQYGGLMPSGWIRWLLEQFEFPFTVVYPQTLDAGDLHQKFDDILFSDGAIPAPREGGGGRFSRQPKPEQIPAEFRPWLGTITADKTIPQLQKFVEDGGTLLAIGTSTSIAHYFNLPLENALTEIVKGKDQPVSPERFYIPGSLIRTQVDTANPIAYGMPAKVDVFFDHSPAFRANPDANLRGIQTIAWYGGGNLLDSGWAWGQQYLNNSIAVAQANMGKGKVLLYGPEITFRGQPHSTFKFLFNGLLYGPSTLTTLK